ERAAGEVKAAHGASRRGPPPVEAHPARQGVFVCGNGGEGDRVSETSGQEATLTGADLGPEVTAMRKAMFLRRPWLRLLGCDQLPCPEAEKRVDVCVQCLAGCNEAESACMLV